MTLKGGEKIFTQVKLGQIEPDQTGLIHFVKAVQEQNIYLERIFNLKNNKFVISIFKYTQRKRERKLTFTQRTGINCYFDVRGNGG